MSEKKIRNIFIRGAITPVFIAEQIHSHSENTNIGAHQIFLGQVRADTIEGKKVAAIEYSSYESMALEQMHAIREEIFLKHELICMHAHHSLGLVSAGDISLFVFVSSAHRNHSVQACAEIVERIKSELPVWGKEIFEDKSHQWKVNQ